MTEFQEKQIRDLRLQGTGYRAIASVVGLSRDIVRNPVLFLTLSKIAYTKFSAEPEE